jgi:competence protein ComFB
MSITEKYDFENLVNDSERMVIHELETQLAGVTGVCTCQDCVLDMAALALNNVKPTYQVSLMGRVYAQSGSNDQHAQEISRAVRTAIARIRSNPSHD